MKRMKGKLSVVVTVVAVLTLVSVVGVLAAEVIVDVFSSQSQTVQYQITGSTTFPHQECDFAAPTSGALGDHRDICLNIQGGNEDSQGRFQVSTANQYLLLALDPSVTATAVAQWDGTDENSSIDPIGLQVGGIGQDLTDAGTNDGVLLRVIDSDGLAVDLTMRIYTDGSNWAEQTIRFDSQVSGNDVVDVFMPFDDFVNQTGTMDERNVGAVELEIDATIEAGADMTIKFIKATSLYDFGDLPSGYNVTTSEGGPQHTVGPLRLGTSVDAEADGTHSATAVADDNDASPDDEDGVIRRASFFAPHGGWTNGTVADGNGGHLEVTISGSSGYPQVFVDFGLGLGLTEVTLRQQNGTAYSGAFNPSTYDVYFDIPSGTFDGNNNISIPVRVRLSSAGGLDADGIASDGEVEDYIFDFGPNAVTLAGINAGPALAGLPAFAMVIAAVVGGAGLFIWKRRA